MSPIKKITSSSKVFIWACPLASINWTPSMNYGAGSVPSVRAIRLAPLCVAASFVGPRQALHAGKWTAVPFHPALQKMRIWSVGEESWVSSRLFMDGGNLMIVVRLWFGRSGQRVVAVCAQYASSGRAHESGRPGLGFAEMAHNKMTD